MPELRGLALECGSALGCFGMVRSLTKQAPCVLTYHGFVDDARKSQGKYRYLFRNSISIGRFEQHLTWLRRTAQLLDPDEFLAFLDSGRPPIGKGVLITIDDGCRSAFELAVPVLRAHGVRAVFLVPTHGVGEVTEGRRWAQWHEDLAARLLTDSSRLATMWRDLRQIAETLPPVMSPNTHDCIRALEQAGLSLPRNRLDRFLDLLSDACPTRPEDTSIVYGRSGGTVLDLIGWHGLREARDQGMEIGSHTATHARMAVLDADDLVSEISHSKKHVETNLGTPCRFFSAPYGRLKDCSPLQARLLEEAGYRAGFTQERTDVVAPRRRFSLGRMDVAPYCTLGRLDYYLSLPWGP